MSDVLKSHLDQMAREWNRAVDLLPTGAYRLDVPLVYNDGLQRNQFVFVRVSPNFARGKDVYYITSRAGTFTPSVNLHQIMREAGLGVYSMITIIDDKDENGNPCETILVQASPIVEYTNQYDLLKFVVTEVASVADFLEQKYLGGADKH